MVSRIHTRNRVNVILASMITCACFWPRPTQSAPFPEAAGEGDTLLDIGDHQSKPHLGFGWSRAERGASGHYRWISHLEADLYFDVEQPGDAELWITAAPLYLPYRRQVIALYFNGSFLTDWLCKDRSDFSDYHAAVPAHLLRVGRNTLTLRMGYRKRGGDERELSLAVDRVLLRLP